ncbi:MAG: hypothetical protein ACI4ES_00230 [Roseburia sp.]
MKTYQKLESIIHTGDAIYSNGEEFMVLSHGEHATMLLKKETEEVVIVSGLSRYMEMDDTTNDRQIVWKWESGKYFEDFSKKVMELSKEKEEGYKYIKVSPSEAVVFASLGYEACENMA